MNYLTTKEIAKRLNVSYATIRRLIKSCKIECVAIGGQLRISENALQAYLDKSVLKENESLRTR